MEINNKTITFSPFNISEGDRLYPVDPIVPADIFRDIAVRPKRPTYTHSTRGRETYKPLKAHSEKAKEIFELSFSHEPLH
jgi:hypothetical protein